MKTKLILITIILCLYSCSNNAQKSIKIEQINSNYPILLEYYEVNKQNKELRVSFPLAFKIKNKMFKTIDISMDFGYYNGNNYGLYGTGLRYWGGRCCVYTPTNGELKMFNPFYIPFFQSKECVFTATHFYKESDTTEILQRFLKPYWDKMTTLDKDTLHIASIQELKKTNPELLNTFLKGDSIELTFYYDELYHGIKLPVEIK